MDDKCPHCAWDFPQPTLADAVLGFRECSNCEFREAVPEAERREALWSVEQQIYVLERDQKQATK
jgi:hypothetical protein